MVVELCAFLFPLLFRLSIVWVGNADPFNWLTETRANTVNTADNMPLSPFQNTIISGCHIYGLLSTFVLLFLWILVFYRNYTEVYIQNGSQIFSH